MEKLTTLFLTLLVTPLLAYDNQEVKLDLTLPETPFDYEQMDRDSKLIKEWEERKSVCVSLQCLMRPNVVVLTFKRNRLIVLFGILFLGTVSFILQPGKLQNPSQPTFCGKL